MTSTTGAVRPLNGHTRPDTTPGHPMSAPGHVTGHLSGPGSVPGHDSGHQADTWPDNWPEDWPTEDTVSAPDSPADTTPDTKSVPGYAATPASTNTTGHPTPGKVTGPGSVPGRTSPGPGSESGPVIRLTPASMVKMKPVYWTWADRIPSGSITLVPGREGIGKSLFLAWMTAQVTKGTLPGRFFGTPRAVIYAATEDSWAQTIAPRLYAAGADLEKVYRVDVFYDGASDTLTLPRDCTALAVHIEALGVALLAADPLLSLVHESIDPNHDRKLRTALEPLAKMADQTGCAVVGLAHFNKSAGTDALSLITGSRAFAAVARAALAVARDTEAEDGSCVLSQVKHNLGSLDLPSLRYIVESAEVPTEEGPAHVGKLVFTGESERSVQDILRAAAAPPENTTDRDRAAEWLTDYLTEQGGTAALDDIRQAAKAAGIAERTLERCRARAKVTSTRAGFPARAVWTLPAEVSNQDMVPVPPVPPQSRLCPDVGGTGGTAPDPPGVNGPVDNPLTTHQAKGDGNG